MKTKRTLSALLAALMLLMLVPAAGLAAAPDAADESARVKLVSLGESKAEAEHETRSNKPHSALDDALNWHGTDLYYETGADYPFVPGEVGGYTCAVCGNTGVDGSTSYITAYYETGEQRFNAVNETRFSFAVYFSTERDHDRFVFYIDGEEQFSLSGYEQFDSSGWNYYSMELEDNTAYTFTWAYEKDASGADLEDMVCVRDITVSRLIVDSIARAANAAGCPVTYRESNYETWMPAESPDGRLCSAPNMDMWYSTVGVEGYASLETGDAISFDYYVDLSPEAEAAGGATFTFAVNNHTALTVTADTQGWQHFSYTMTTGYNNPTDRFSWSYRKPNTDDTDTSAILLDEVSVTYNHPAPFDEVLYDEYSFLHFTSEGEYPFVVNRHSDIHPIYAVSGNSGADDSESILHTEVSLMAGDMLIFDYYISSEPDDRFILRVDGEELLRDSGWQGEHFETMGVQAMQSGSFGVDFVYKKDGSFGLGLDCLRIRNVYVYHLLDNALNAPGNYLEFYTTDENPFFTRELEDGRIVAQSYLNIARDEASAIACYVDMKAGETLSFEYWLDCVNAADYFLFGANGELVYYDSGSMLGWKSYTFTAPADGEYFFEWVYQRGDSYTADYNCLRVDNVAYSGSIEPAEGDIDADGSVTANDALLVLRAALGLISLTPAQQLRADIDGDGNITANDALMILRAALGIAAL